jgi:hypothetical protein
VPTVSAASRMPWRIKAVRRTLRPELTAVRFPPTAPATCLPGCTVPPAGGSSPSHSGQIDVASVLAESVLMLSAGQEMIAAPDAGREVVWAMDRSAPSGRQRQDDCAGARRAELPADPASARHARQTVREALAAWGNDDPDRDAELPASELVANAAEHAPGASSSFAMRAGTGSPRWVIGSQMTAPADRGGWRGGIRNSTCELTDTPLSLPQIQQSGPDQERGRGMAIVNALAAASGVQVEPVGKTTWFTLALHDRVALHAEPDQEAGALSHPPDSDRTRERS